MASKLSPRVEKRATYTTLTGIFIGAFALFGTWKGRRGKRTAFKPFDLIQVGLASYRLGRMISYDKVAEGYRAPFTRTVPDPSGEGMTVVPKGRGTRAAIGELIACPICAGTWIAAGLVYGMSLFPEGTRTFLAIMSAIGFAEFVNSATEALEWTGQLARERAGTERASHDDPHDHTAHDHHARVQSFPTGELPRRRFDDRVDWRKPQQNPPAS